MKQNPIAIASYSFHGMHKKGSMDLFQYLEVIRSRYQVSQADIWSGYLVSLETDYIKQVRQEMDRRGLSLANLCVDGPVLWTPDPEQREENYKTMLRYIEAAHVLGAKTIRIDFGGKDGDTMTEEAFDLIVRRYKNYCSLCYDLGMKIGPENHFGLDRNPDNLKKVWREVDHPAYGHLLHFGNLPDFMKQMDMLLPIVMHTHVAANSLPEAKEIIRRLMAAGYEGAWSVEHHTAELELERVEWQLASLRAILAELRKEDLAGPAKPDYMQTVYK